MRPAQVREAPTDILSEPRHRRRVYPPHPGPLERAFDRTERNCSRNPHIHRSKFRNNERRRARDHADAAIGGWLPRSDRPPGRLSYCGAEQGRHVSSLSGSGARRAAYPTIRGVCTTTTGPPLAPRRTAPSSVRLDAPRVVRGRPLDASLPPRRSPCSRSRSEQASLRHATARSRGRAPGSRFVRVQRPLRCRKVGRQPRRSGMGPPDPCPSA